MSSRKAAAAPASQHTETIKIDDRRALAVKQREIAARVNANPALGVMLFINPVLALEAFGVKLSKEVAHHVLHRTQHPVPLRERREMLEKTLEAALGEKPRPNDEEWVATVLFDKLALAPLDTEAQVPRYKEPLNAAAVRRAQKFRPPSRRRYPQPRRLKRKASVATAAWTPAVRRMDLDAQVSRPKTANTRPRAVSLEALYFYKDTHELARALLELGILQRQSFPFHTPDAFRRILEGGKPNAFRSWIRGVRLPERSA